jgi:hypothetical protein
MANSMALMFIKPTVAFKRGDTFVFGSWVCTADGVGSFQHRLTMAPNPETGLVTLPEVSGQSRWKIRRNFTLQPTHRLRARIQLQLELDVLVGNRMRVGYLAIVCGLPTS